MEYVELLAILPCARKSRGLVYIYVIFHYFIQTLKGEEVSRSHEGLNLRLPLYIRFVFIGCGHTWDLTLVKGFNRGKKDVKKLYYSKTH